MFAHYWPSLLAIPNFIHQFITPIVKVNRGSRELVFFTVPEYETWKAENGDGEGWTIKYYKVFFIKPRDWEQAPLLKQKSTFHGWPTMCVPLM